MPTVAFESSEIGPPASAEIGAGGRLLDVCDDTGAPVAFSCRAATCGTCRVEVVEGADLLEPARPDERGLLAILAAPPSHRLACQAIVRAGAGRLLLRWIDGGR